MNDLLGNPFVLFLLTTLTGVVGFVGAKMIDRAFTTRDRESSLASRLASIEANMNHVLADQAAHQQAQKDINDLKVTVARIETRSVEKWAGIENSLKLIDSQNRQIWRKLNAPDNARAA